MLNDAEIAAVVAPPGTEPAAMTKIALALIVAGQDAAWAALDHAAGSAGAGGADVHAHAGMDHGAVPRAPSENGTDYRTHRHL
jgi:hypothetical protein